MRRIFLAFLSVLIAFSAQAQVFNPVSWQTEVEDLKDGTFALKVTAQIEEGWHLYSQTLPSEDGPIATEFTFPEGEAYTLVGKVEEPKAKTEYDPNFDMDLNYFEKKVTFIQKVKPTSPDGFELTAEVYFMVCDAEKCLPPEYVDLNFKVPASGTTSQQMPEETGDASQEIKEAESTNKVDTEAMVDNSFENATEWEYFVTKGEEEGKYELHFKARIGEGWHLYSQKQKSEEEQVMATKFYVNKALDADAETKEMGELISAFDATAEMHLDYYEKEVEFVREVGNDSSEVIVEFEFIVCNESMCLPPELTEIVFNLNTGKAVNALDLETEEAKIDVSTIIPHLPLVDLENPVSDCGEEKTEVSNVWTVFLFGFLGGLIALLTPCVFPMIPLTVSFFTKGDGEGKGVGKAVLYGFFIFGIYAILSIPFHFNTDPEVLNEIATSVWLNIIFFVVFVVFAISFFGYFEITLPSSLTNKADSASQVGGVLGIFFMALTLALVSFSCTGPILGTVLGNALKNGPWPITAAMSGFGLALGLPFAIFATFPSMMNKLPKSGGWLNSVKVVLGFIELALAVKFLSNADLVEQWGLLKRETFFLIWILIGAGLVAYLIGLIKFPHDSPLGRISPFRLGFAALILAFTIYIAPGVLKNSPWNHNLLSGFPPPTFYSWYEKETFHAEFMDFDEAIAEAKKQNKPLLIDFTGWACVNCRKMEESVWTVQKIKDKLEEDFVLVSLYVDDKVKLPEDQQGVFEYQAGNELKKKKIKTIGNKWATFQTQVFNNNSQPYYVMLSPEGKLLGNPVGYTPDVEEYEDFLDCGISAYLAEKGLAKN